MPGSSGFHHHRMAALAGAGGGPTRRITMGARRARVRSATFQPDERTNLPPRRRLVAHVLAVVLPTAVSVVLIPLRADHGQTAAIVLVVPVVVVAAMGTTSAAVLAAFTAGLAYDVFLTRPYLHVVVTDPDDVVAMVTLILVGLTVGVLSSRLVRSSARAATRHRELQQLASFVRTVAAGSSADELERAACAAIAEVLELRECQWVVGYHGTSAPVLTPDGEVMGFLTELNPDRAKLPRHLELPAVAGVELGRFVMVASDDHVASREERLTAATIASLYAAAMRDDR